MSIVLSLRKNKNSSIAWSLLALISLELFNLDAYILV